MACSHALRSFCLVRLGCTCGILCQFLVRSMRSPSRGRTKYASKKIRIDPQRWFMKRFFSCRGNFRNLGYVSEICSNILEWLISFFLNGWCFPCFSVTTHLVSIPCCQRNCLRLFVAPWQVKILSDNWKDGENHQRSV